VWSHFFYTWKNVFSGASLGTDGFSTNKTVLPLSNTNPTDDRTAAQGAKGLEGSPMESAATWAWLGLNVARSGKYTADAL
jgi:hypothetical protein